MSKPYFSRNSIEILEARIAPAALAKAYPTIAQAEAMPNGAGFVTAQIGTPVLVHAGQVLETGSGPESGEYLLFVQQGEALVFFTDLNNNGVVDPNEITGIAAGNGLRLISFVDIHGDIVTDLNASGTLSDSHNNAALSNSALGGDGAVLLNNSISLIEFRSLTQADLSPGENIALRYAPTNYSLYGNIYAGAGFGTSDGGLIVDNSQASAVATALNGVQPTYSNPGEPVIGGIYTGTAAAGQFFSFGASSDGLHPSGIISPFIPAVGAAGGDIMNVGASDGATVTTTSTTAAGATTTTTTAAKTAFNIGTVMAGNGGIGGRGGNLQNITLIGDTAAGYSLIAGNGGSGPTGGLGGSILNYSDSGSVTGAINVQSGNGGVGTTGAGGAGGTVTFGSISVAAGMTVNLGNGGNGFTSGGAGASLPSGALVTQNYTLAPNATVVVSTTHTNGSIGTTTPIDFDGDGKGDVVYATENPSELVVLLDYNANTGAFAQRIILPMPYNDIDGVTVGDFLGNGHMDIAAVSGDPTTSPGVVVFLSEFSTKGVFEGFSAPRYSPLPDLFSGDPTQPGLAFGFVNANIPVAQVVSGNFAGDGHVGLAIAATYYSPNGTPTPTPNEVVMFLKPVLVNGQPTGQFAADFGTTSGGPGIPASPVVPFTIIGVGNTSAYLEATALSTGAGFDVVAAVPSAGFTQTGIDIISNNNPSITGPGFTIISTGSVDTNRTLNLPGQLNNQAIVPAVAGPFTILDFGGKTNANGTEAPDGNADFAVLTQSPVGYMVSIEGNGAGGGTIVSGSGNDNAGTFFGNNGYNIGTSQILIKAANLDGSGSFDNVAILDYDTATFGPLYYGVLELTPEDPGTPASPGVPANPNPNYSVTNPGSLRLGFTAVSDFLGAPVTSIAAFDVFTPRLNHPNTPTFITGIPDNNPLDLGTNNLEITNAVASDNTLYFPTLEIQNFFHINAGNGGDGLVGAGGVGGTLGSVLNTVTTKTSVTVTNPTTGATTTGTVTSTSLLGALSITLPFDTTFDGGVTLDAGTGGNGFTTGGNGGAITGTTVSYGTGVATGTGLTPIQLLAETALAAVTLQAGDGGMGVSGAGGNGGNLTANSVAFGEMFTAGNGGTGAHGGNGGSIVGNGHAGFFDTFDTVVQLTAGTGANGVKSGGNGGAITNFHASFNLPVTGGEDGNFSAIGGNGGNASSGAGGNGGGVINDGPLQDAANPGNYMSGDFLLQGGAGGNGLSGGSGGGINTFVDQPSNNITPALLSILAGDGGQGISGAGGHGGAVTAINIPTTGQHALSGFASLTNYDYDRIIAGNGGTSAGAAGGAGGSISNLLTTNSKSGFAIVAGAGGNGLYAGGAGGSVLNSNVQVGGQGGGPNTTNTKLLVVAGDGGSATAFVADLNNGAPNQAQKAYGGRVGVGGNGGTINGLQQAGGVFVNVDLIAGNGGDTVNYGTEADSKFYVGAGGSVENIKVAGEIGNTDSVTPIKSYNDIAAGQTMAQFVAATFVNNPDPFDSILDDSIGSVGIVVGAAGRLQTAFEGYDSNNEPIYQSQPASGGHNGSLINVLAYGGISSAVAGSVDRIATIARVQNVVITHGVIGANKPTAGLYIGPDGLPAATAELGGALIDGALVAGTYPTILVNGVMVPDTELIGNIFIIPATP